jgi:hypothetical protein
MTTIARRFNVTPSNSLNEKKEIKFLKILDFQTKPIFNIILSSLILVVFFFYLLEMNQIVALGFKVDELERHKEDLKKTNKSLEMEKMQLESLSGTSDELANFNFVKTDKIDYLKPVTGLALTKK